MSTVHAIGLRIALCPLLAVTTGCIASNVVAPEQRMVAPDLAALPFVAAPELTLDGLYESLDIQGDAAISLRKIYYRFAPDGTYTAAALAEADGSYAFQTLSGTWQNGERGLVLDGAEPVLLEQAGGHLRITAPTGIVVLVRRELS